VTGPLVTVLTDRAQAAGAGRAMVTTVAAALAGGAGRVVLRERDLPAAARRALAEDLRALTGAAGAAFVVAGDTALAAAVGADGVHLAAADPWRGPAALAGAAAGRSCHTVAELRAAAAEGAAWATYSPVWATGSKPGYGPALGVDGLAAGCRAVPGLAVLALGGVGPGRAGECRAAGAAGVAVMGAVMAAADPEAVVRDLVAEQQVVRA
jgi:thiamine-phosphate pyrophosphorylase